MPLEPLKFVALLAILRDNSKLGSGFHGFPKTVVGISLK